MLSPPEPIELPEQRAVFFPELVDGRGPPPPPASHSLLDLPDELRRHILARVPLADHPTVALVCEDFCGVINDPRFLKFRRDERCAERGIMSIARTHEGDLDIWMAHSGETARIPGNFGRITVSTDGGSRLFVSATNYMSNHQIEHGVWALDASSRRWRRFATLPQGQGQHQCLEWHNGRLYVAGGCRSEGSTLNFSAFNEAIGSWEELQPMLHACKQAASGVIGNELFIAKNNRLQIYDIAGRTWRLGAALPQPCIDSHGVVADGKLFIIANLWSRDLLVYDPRSDTWAEEAPLSTVTNYDFMVVSTACALNGRLVVFLADDTAHERANDGSWSPYEVRAGGTGHYESVILG